jgi:surfeit locus 1 family protein
MSLKEYETLFRDQSIRSAFVATCIGVAILLALGTWQLQRLAWKTALLARIDQAEGSAPVPLGAAPLNFSKVVASGMLLPPTALYGIDVRDRPDGPAREGAQLLQVLRRPGLQSLLVDRGWIPEGVTPPPPAAVTVQISGYIRRAEKPTIFSPADDVENRHFYALDPGAIGAALGVPDLAPFTLVAMGPPAGADGPFPETALPRPPNNHLQYAFTWYGLAATLVGVFAAWARSRRRLG